MRAVVVAAGRGKRMAALTAACPKPLLSVCDRPLLEHILRGLERSGVSEVVVVIGYLGEQIRAAFEDGSGLQLTLRYVWQTGPTGTGSAFLAAESCVGAAPFLLLWGDVLMDDANYRRIQAAYARQPCDLLSMLNWLPDPSAGASVDVDADRIIGITEKPPPGTSSSNWNQAGLFVCTTAVFEAVKAAGVSDRGELEFTEGVRALVDSGADVRWLPLEGFWSDVGTPEALTELEVDPVAAELFGGVRG